MPLAAKNWKLDKSCLKNWGSCFPHIIGHRQCLMLVKQFYNLTSFEALSFFSDILSILCFSPSTCFIKISKCQTLLQVPICFQRGRMKKEQCTLFLRLPLKVESKPSFQVAHHGFFYGLYWEMSYSKCKNLSDFQFPVDNCLPTTFSQSMLKYICKVASHLPSTG